MRPCCNQLGVGKGDRVIIYMPMIPEAVFSMLACARIGAVHSVVFGGFAAHELATRIDDCQAKLVITASCGLEPGRIVAYKPLLDHAIDIAMHKPDHCLVCSATNCTRRLHAGRDVDLANSGGQAERTAGDRGRLRAGAGDRSALRALHLRHHRPAEGRRPRQWRPYGGAAAGR